MLVSYDPVKSERSEAERGLALRKDALCRASQTPS
jgi:hypothetical protein